MKGTMAEEFATTIKNLWNGKYNWINANRLRVCFKKKKNFFFS